MKKRACSPFLWVTFGVGDSRLCGAPLFINDFFWEQSVEGTDGAAACV